MKYSYHFSDADIVATLKDNWGYDRFRPAQMEIIRSVFAGKDTIGLLPTGGGKSITYQVPALMNGGLTVIITPLISLMKDQVDNLRSRGIRAEALHSGLTRREVTLAEDRCRLGKASMLYISPEKLQSAGFVDKLRHYNVKLIVVDEAHCISQWGYDFRPSYLGIADLRKHFPEAPILALTASATPAVIDDISERLQLDEPDVHRLSFTRDNISYVVRYCDFKEQQMVHILQRVAGTGIVYVRSRVRARQIAETLTRSGISAEYYHAGLQPQDKEERQNRWKGGATRVMVATNAFGMGIDKPDVRVVIHHDLPSSLEEYYQEAGRAGRDGLPSFAVLLTNKSDRTLLSRRLNDTFPPKDVIRKVYENVGNYFALAVGDGYNQLFEFSLDQFCVNFKFMPNIVHSALTILSRAGYIDYSEEMSTRSRLMMIMKRDELYGVTLSAESERVLQAVLRSTTGIFADYEHISEAEIARRTGYSEQTVYESLLALTREHVLHYIPKKTASYIFYTTSREEPQHLKFPIAVYEERRKRMEERLDAMARFAFDAGECRVNTMLRYFGETPTQPCGKCDVCRANRETSASAEKAKQARTEAAVMNVLRAARVIRLPQLLALFGGDEKPIIEAVRRLADEGEIVLEGTEIRLPR